MSVYKYMSDMTSPKTLPPRLPPPSLETQAKINKLVCDAVLRTGFVESPFYGWELANAINWQEVDQWCKELRYLIKPNKIRNLVANDKIWITKAELNKYAPSCYQAGVPDTLEFRIVCTLASMYSKLKNKRINWISLDKPYIQGQDFRKAIENNHVLANKWARSQGRRKQDRYFTILLVGNNGDSGVVYIPRADLTAPQTPKQFCAYLLHFLNLPMLHCGEISHPVSHAIVHAINPEITSDGGNNVVLIVRVRVTNLVTDPTGMFARVSIADIL